jgi:hypothetical protein
MKYTSLAVVALLGGSQAMTIRNKEEVELELGEQVPGNSTEEVAGNGSTAFAFGNKFDFGHKGEEAKKEKAISGLPSFKQLERKNEEAFLTTGKAVVALEGGKEDKEDKEVKEAKAGMMI